MKIEKDFFLRDVLDVAPDLIGKKLVRVIDGLRSEYYITEVEGYRGEEDLACHASKGRTRRTEVMFHEGGKLYIYFIYGIYHMLNIVAGPEGLPQAVLIRGVKGVEGPGKLTRALKIDQSFYGEEIYNSNRLWIEDGLRNPDYITLPRVGINYAGEYWISRMWRWKLNEFKGSGLMDAIRPVKNSKI